MRLRTGFLLLVLMAVLGRPVEAQSCGTSCAPATVRMRVVPTVRLELLSDPTSLGNPTAADFTVGYKDATGPTLTVRANSSYQVDVVKESPAPTFGTTSKPASDLLWGTAPGTYPYHVGTSAMLTSGGATAGSAPVTIYYRTLWSFANDPPGTYTIGVMYTVSAP